MKGVILAGGLATRLRPLTMVTNKHLLPVYHKPMIYYPLEAMQKAGIKEVLLSTSSDHAGHFANLLQAGENFHLKLYYAIQQNAKGGIADAIYLAQEFAHNEPIIVILGDNIFNHNLKQAIVKYEKQGGGAMIFGVNKDTQSKHYGVIEIDDDGNVVSIEEKPENPKSKIAQTGIYIYDEHVFEYISRLKPSERGELEVTDLNNIYLNESKITCEIIDWWIDAGSSHDELIRANNQVAQFVKEGKL